MLSNGYVHDTDCVPEITFLGDAEFTTISDKTKSDQSDKEVMSFREITHTFTPYVTSYTIPETPEIELETQFGMFQYAFMYVEFPQTDHSVSYPSSSPVITSFKYSVRGRQNLFVRDLDSDDIERLSRSNCHEDTNWRELHEKGQGIPIHLEDIGLVEEVPFGLRERIVLHFKLLTTRDPAVETFENVSTQDALDGTRNFNVVLLRDNQIFEGSFTQNQFRLLNQ